MENNWREFIQSQLKVAREIPPINHNKDTLYGVSLYQSTVRDAKQKHPEVMAQPESRAMMIQDMVSSTPISEEKLFQHKEVQEAAEHVYAEAVSGLAHLPPEVAIKVLADINDSILSMAEATVTKAREEAEYQSSLLTCLATTLTEALKAHGAIQNL